MYADQGTAIMMFFKEVIGVHCHIGVKIKFLDTFVKHVFQHFETFLRIGL
jgi:diaminopimelate decarboxylase